MGAILEQLGLDRTFFYQFAIFVVLFVLLGNIYFKSFLRLFEARRKRTIEDREAAEKLMTQAQSKFEEYKRRLSEERSLAKQEFDRLLNDAKKEEALLLSNARNEAKKITQAATDSIQQQREQLKSQLAADVDQLAKTISEKLLLRKE